MEILIGILSGVAFAVGIMFLFFDLVVRDIIKEERVARRMHGRPGELICPICLVRGQRLIWFKNDTTLEVHLIEAHHENNLKPLIEQARMNTEVVIQQEGMRSWQ